MTAIGSPERKAESQASLIYGISITLVTLSFTCVLLRLYTRLVILRTFGSEDTAIVVAQILSFGYTVVTIVQVALGGLGTHIEFIRKDQYLVAAKTIYAGTLIYNAAQITTKLSFLLQYRRLFSGVAIQRVCKIGIVFLAAWGLTQTLLTGFSCNQLIMIDARRWQGHCVSTFLVFSLIGIMNLVTDFAIFAIPIRPVLKLNLPKRRKMNLLAVFCLGFFACAISIIRLAEVYLQDGSPDPSYDSTKLSYWSVIELNCGIICACLPTLRPIIKKLAPSLMRSLDGQTKGRTSHKLSHKLASFRTTKPKSELADGIYIHRDLEFHSTTELRSMVTAKGGSAERDTWVEIEAVEPNEAYKGDGSSPYVPPGRH